jgi:hypothetical protein
MEPSYEVLVAACSFCVLHRFWSNLIVIWSIHTCKELSLLFKNLLSTILFNFSLLRLHPLCHHPRALLIITYPKYW